MKNHSEKPIWLNPNKYTLVPSDTLLFKIVGDNWTASLHSFVQPIALKTKQTNDSLTLTFVKPSGIIEGSSILTLATNDQEFHFDLSLINRKTDNIIKKDYRSPKTVNPDSSLKQHRLMHNIDVWRNITPLTSKDTLFYEDNIYLQPYVATYQAQKDKPLTSFYVQAGSCTTIPVQYNYNVEKKGFTVNVGPLTDKHGNTVADGTIVIFSYSDSEKQYHRETHLFNGYASTFVAETGNKKLSLYVKINETSSTSIQLTSF